MKTVYPPSNTVCGGYKKCPKKIVGLCPIFMQIIVKVYDPVNVMGVFLTFFFVDFTTFLLTLIEEGTR